MFFILDTAERLGFTQIWAELEPRSPQGKKVKKAVQPLRPGEEAQFEQTAAELACWLRLARETDLVEKLEPLLLELKSITGILERLAAGEALDEGECFALKANLATTRKIANALREVRQLPFLDDSSAKAGEELVGNLQNNRAAASMTLAGWIKKAVQLAEEPLFTIDPLDRLWSLLNPTGQETERFYLYDSYDPALVVIRQQKDQLQQAIRQQKRSALAELELQLKRTIPTSGEVMLSKGDEASLNYLQSRRDLKLERETFSAYFYQWLPGPDVQELENRLEEVEAEEGRITVRVFKRLSQEIAQDWAGLAKNQEQLGELDWILTRVQYAQKHSCVPAEQSAENRIEIYGGRHLLVEAEVLKRGDHYTPIDLTVAEGVTVVTGSNMGGKTLNLRMVGLLTAMAQHGLCVPVEKMRFALRDFIYFSVDDDQTKGDLSTFGQEIAGLNQALAFREQQGLYLIDELARGTNPEEGEALGSAIIKYLRQSPCITLLTTHFSALAGIRGVAHYRVHGLDQERYEELRNTLEDQISLKMINQLMDYRLEKVGHDEGVARDAIRVASLLGLNDTIITDAEKRLQKRMKRTKGVSYSGEKIKSGPKTD